jgi:four helix bundle protein
MTEESWRKLRVWNLTDEMAFRVYEVTKKFPKEEIYGITSQLRRSALSIPTNIVEGYARKGDAELAHFLSISFASLAETKYLIYFSKKLGYLCDSDYTELRDGYDEAGKSLWSFYAKVKKNR